jgi:hypothetical protein
MIRYYGDVWDREREVWLLGVALLSVLGLGKFFVRVAKRMMF